MPSELPQKIRDRTPAPHALRVAVRSKDVPDVREVAGFCLEAAWKSEAGAFWFRIVWGADSLLVLFEEGQGTGQGGFEHALRVESGVSKACFLAAYFIARRCGGVVQIRQRAAVHAAGAFAERYLEGEDLEVRWDRATSRS